MNFLSRIKVVFRVNIVFKPPSAPLFTYPGTEQSMACTTSTLSYSEIFIRCTFQSIVWDNLMALIGGRYFSKGSFGAGFMYLVVSGVLQSHLIFVKLAHCTVECLKVWTNVKKLGHLSGMGVKNYAKYLAV